MLSHHDTKIVERQMRIGIKELVAAGLDNASGSLTVATTPSGLDFPAWIEGKGDHVLISIHGGWGNTYQGVALTETPCHYGGTRKWFVCPSCRRRCGVLYCSQSIACRKCHGLLYESQYEAPRERMLRRLLKIRKLIGADMDIWGPFNPPPRGMSIGRWRALIDKYKVLREEFRIESEKPCKWRAKES